MDVQSTKTLALQRQPLVEFEGVRQVYAVEQRPGIQRFGEGPIAFRNGGLEVLDIRVEGRVKAQLVSGGFNDVAAERLAEVVDRRREPASAFELGGLGPE